MNCLECPAENAARYWSEFGKWKKQKCSKRASPAKRKKNYLTANWKSFRQIPRLAMNGMRWKRAFVEISESELANHRPSEG